MRRGCMPISRWTPTTRTECAVGPDRPQALSGGAGPGQPRSWAGTAPASSGAGGRWNGSGQGRNLPRWSTSCPPRCAASWPGTSSRPKRPAPIWRPNADAGGAGREAESLWRRADGEGRKAARKQRSAALRPGKPRSGRHRKPSNGSRTPPETRREPLRGLRRPRAGRGPLWPALSLYGPLWRP